MALGGDMYGEPPAADTLGCRPEPYQRFGDEYRSGLNAGSDGLYSDIAGAAVVVTVFWWEDFVCAIVGTRDVGMDGIADIIIIDDGLNSLADNSSSAATAAEWADRTLGLDCRCIDDGFDGTGDDLADEDDVR
jgi:hypothetical protein